jgi:hypothetical protein
MMGKVFSHHHGEEISSTAVKFELATELYTAVSNLSRKVLEEAANSPNCLSLAAPLSLTFSTLCVLCGPYSCPESGNYNAALPEASDMQAKAVDGLKTVARSVVDFAEQLNAATPLPQDLDRISPLVMDSIYSAAANYAWLVRESSEESSQMALEQLRHCLRRFGARWRNAAEYLRILEAKEFTYAVGSGGSC